jgi:hypothetical protein
MFKRVVLSLAILILTASSAAAQRRPDTHSGFWLGGGAGGGWFEGTRGGAVYIRLGGTPHKKALFGGEVLTWFRGDGSQTNVTATALLYPFYTTTGVPGHDLFLKTGFGVAANDADDAGVGLTFGTGYDFRIGDNLYVTPNFDLMIQFLNDLTFTAVLFTLGLGFH